MKIVPYVRQRPDIKTEWGNYTSPYVVYNPADYRNRRPAPPDRTQGRHAIRNQPRPVGIRSMVTGARPGIEGSTAAYSGYDGYYTPGLAAASDRGLAKSKNPLIEMLLVAGALGIFGYLIYRLFKSSEFATVKENPVRRRTRAQGKTRYKKSGGRVNAVKGRKCRECGKFISRTQASAGGYCTKHAASQ